MQTDATTSNIVGSCSSRYWMFLAVVCKRTQLLAPLLGVVPADVRCFWQWCENGCNNFGISSPSWARKLAIFVRRGNVVYPLRVFLFSSASVLDGVISCSSLSKSTSCPAIISRTKIAHIHVARYTSPWRLHVKRVRSPNNVE